MLENAFRTHNIASSFLGDFCRHNKVIFFDTETTGLGKSAKIIEFAAIRCEIKDGWILIPECKYHVFINPQEELNPKIEEITGLSTNFLKQFPTEDIQVPEIIDFLSTADLWIAYNASFDERMIDQALVRTKLQLKNQKIILDALPLIRDCIPKTEVENYKLGTITDYLFPNEEINYHEAAEDVNALIKCTQWAIHETLNYNLAEMEVNNKKTVFLNWASLWINPQKKSMVRIKVNIDDDNYGNIFWDVVEHSWSCKKTKAAQQLFETIDLNNLEKQMIEKYGRYYNASDMDTLAQNWFHKKKK